MKIDSDVFYVSVFRILSRRTFGYLGCLDVEALEHYVDGYVFARTEAAVAARWLSGSIPPEVRPTVMERFAAWLDPAAKYPVWVRAVRTRASSLGRESDSALLAIELFAQFLQEKEGIRLHEAVGSPVESLASPKPSMTLEEAVARARPLERPDLVPIVALWVGIGWVVAFQTAAYVDARASTARTVEWPQLVSDDGSCIEFAPPVPWTVSLVRFATSSGIEARLEPWVRELAEREMALGFPERA